MIELSRIILSPVRVNILVYTRVASLALAYQLRLAGADKPSCQMYSIYCACMVILYIWYLKPNPEIY